MLFQFYLDNYSCDIIKAKCTFTFSTKVSLFIYNYEFSELQIFSFT